MPWIPLFKNTPKPTAKKLGEKKREKDYDYSDSGIKATRAPQAILRGEPDLEKIKRETTDYHEAKLSCLARGLRRRRRKRPTSRSKAAGRHTFRKEEASGEKMTALVKDTACSQLAIHKRDSQLTTKGNRHKTSLSKR